MYTIFLTWPVWKSSAWISVHFISAQNLIKNDHHLNSIFFFFNFIVFCKHFINEIMAICQNQKQNIHYFLFGPTIIIVNYFYNLSSKCK